MAGGPAATTLAYDPWGRLDSVTAGGATTSFRYAGAQLGGEFNLFPEYVDTIPIDR
ncbi:hypothetical protein [Phenylobacterium sp.]|uniref:hypothetical protein n=1 Tax=Phenylobacterium sp. TaxID=1871053 RepID=UPI00286BD8F2|nr:hypothetical protein [Phenylobacterium sp.]